jgi:hypothetical protein
MLGSEKLRWYFSFCADNGLFPKIADCFIDQRFKWYGATLSHVSSPELPSGSDEEQETPLFITNVFPRRP